MFWHGCLKFLNTEGGPHRPESAGQQRDICKMALRAVLQKYELYDVTYLFISCGILNDVNISLRSVRRA